MTLGFSLKQQGQIDVGESQKIPGIRAGMSSLGQKVASHRQGHPSGYCCGLGPSRLSRRIAKVKEWKR